MSLKPDSRADVTHIDIVSSGDIAQVTNDQNVDTKIISTTTDVALTTISADVAATTVANLDLTESASVDNLVFDTTPEIKRAITPSTGQTTGEHAALHGLDYKNSGHTGFASAEDLEGKQSKFTLGPTLQ